MSVLVGRAFQSCIVLGWNDSLQATVLHNGIWKEPLCMHAIVLISDKSVPGQIGTYHRQIGTCERQIGIQTNRHLDKSAPYKLFIFDLYIVNQKLKFPGTVYV